MKRKKVKIIVVTLVFIFFTSGIVFFWYESTNKPHLFLATTTSLSDSGLLSEILPDFECKNNIKVCVIAVGTGQALEYGKRGDADLLMVHAPELEKDFMAFGYGVERREIFQNYFVLIGPIRNPAGISSKDNITQAFWKIYTSNSNFVSRGDFSGTHLREIHIWNSLNISVNLLKTKSWYLNGSGSMSTAMMLANEKDAYVLSDVATWAFLKQKIGNLRKFEIQKTEELVNVYSLIITKKSVEKKRETVERFKAWLESSETLSRIENYTIDSEQIFWARW